ncbi:MAG: hypothetical protein ACD_43C00212G0006 [uncultured bacterium]|nr:MAG: hypothetical protein ACD_43C00212G0006 [uncultured bacterium]
MPELEPNLEQWSARDLFARLLKSGQKGGQGIERFVRLPVCLELGVVQQRLDQLREHTRVTGKEAGLAITYDPHSRKILIDRTYTEGFGVEDGQGAAPINVGYSVTREAEQAVTLLSEREKAMIYRGFGQLEQDIEPAVRLFNTSDSQAELLRRFVRRPIGTMHSHPNEVPFSAGDIATMLNSLKTQQISFHVLARPSGISEALIMCKETEALSAEEAVKCYRRWDEAVNQRMYQARGEEQTPDRVQVFTKINEALLRSLANKYRFGWYQNSVDQPSVLKRVLS